MFQSLALIRNAASFTMLPTKKGIPMVQVYVLSRFEIDMHHHQFKNSMNKFIFESTKHFERLTPNQLIRGNYNKVAMLSELTLTSGKTFLMTKKANQLALNGEKVVFFIRPCAAKRTWDSMQHQRSQRFKFHYLESETDHCQKLLDVVQDKYYKDFHIFVDELVISEQKDIVILKKISQQDDGDAKKANQVVWLTMTAGDATDRFDIKSELEEEFFIPQLMKRNFSYFKSK